MSFTNQPDEGLTLDSLLATLNGMTKSASDESDKDEKEEKDLPPFMKKDEEKSEGKSEGKSDEKKDEDKKSDEKKDDGQTKEAASRAGAALAQEILAKFASTTAENVQPMNKQASVAGQALAQALLKQAGNGDMTTTNGVTPGAVPQKTTVDNAALEAEGASYIKPMLTGDGVTNQGTLNQIFDAIIQDAVSQGAAGMDQVHQTGIASQEGNVEDHAVPNQIKVAQLNELLAQGVDFDEAVTLMKQAADAQAADDLEKMAAVQELVARGETFEAATELVKQAAEEIAQELEKSAALSELMAEGIDFESAVALIKEASAGDMTTQDGVTPGSAPQKTTQDNAAMNAEGDSAIKPMPTGDGVRNSGTLNQIFDGLVADAQAQGAAGVDQVHQTGIAGQEGAVEDHAVPNQVKVAYMNELLAQGVDFDEAAQMVKEAGALAVIPKPVLTPLSRMDRLKNAAKGVLSNRDKMSTLTHAGAGALGIIGGYNVGSSGQEKAAAVNELVSEGVEFDEAVTLVKQAGAGKNLMRAGVDRLVGAGTSPGSAAVGRTMYRAGSAIDAGERAVGGAVGKAKDAVSKAVHGNGVIHVTSGGTAMGQRASQVRGAVIDSADYVKGQASRFAADAKGVAKGGNTLYVTPGGKAMGARAFHGKNLATNPLTLAGAGAAAVGGGAYAIGREKKAAFDALVEGGVDFDTAAQLVSQKARELYGE